MPDNMLAMRKKILLVDDDPVSHFIHTKVIQRLCTDCDFYTAQSAEHALIILNNDMVNPPDLILLDLNMPAMDGFQFMQQFDVLQFPNKASIHVAILTSSLRPDDSEAAARLGVHRFLRKPLSDRDASAIISDLFRDA